MKHFQTLLFFLIGLLSVGAFAEEAYDTTIYLTNTVTQVYTVTRSGPSSAVANSTSTIYPSSTLAYGTKAAAPYPSANVTSSPTKGGPSATGSATGAAPFTGAAAQLNGNVVAVVLAVGMGLLAL